METEESIQQQITRLELAHSQLQSKSLKLVDQIGTLEDALIKINVDIENIILPQQKLPHEVIEKGKIQQLQNQIKKLEEQYLAVSAALAQTKEYDQQVSDLLETQKNLKEKLLQTVSIDETGLTAIQTQISKYKSIEKQSHKIMQIQADIKRQHQNLVNIQKQIDSIIAQPINSVANEKNDQEINKLEKQILLLQKQLLQIDSHLHDQKERKKNEQQQLKIINQNLNQQLSSLKLQVQDLEKQCSKFTEKLNHESNYSNNSEVSINLAKIQAEVNQKQAKIQLLIKNIEAIKEQLKKEEQRISNEQKKLENRKNMKDLIKKAQVEAVNLKNQKESLQGIYNRLVTAKKGYVNLQSLQILQRQLKRHQRLNAPSLQTKENELQKLKKQNSGLKQAIKRLNRLRQQIETREQKNLNDIRKKKDILSIQKLQLDKDLAEVNFKINQYIKHFPYHEAQKEAKKKIKIKKTNSLNGQFQLPKEKKKKEVAEQILQFRILGEDQDGDEQHRRQSYGSELLKNTKWHKRRSSDNFEVAPDKPLYKNTYFLAAAGLLLILIIAALQ